MIQQTASMGQIEAAVDIFLVGTCTVHTVEALSVNIPNKNVKKCEVFSVCVFVCVLHIDQETASMGQIEAAVDIFLVGTCTVHTVEALSVNIPNKNVKKCEVFSVCVFVCVLHIDQETASMGQIEAAVDIFLVGTCTVHTVEALSINISNKNVKKYEVFNVCLQY